MIRVKTRSNEPIEKTLRRFKKRCEKEGLTKDIKKSAYFEKPSEKRRRWQRKLEKEKKKVEWERKMGKFYY
jgi:small subunit ribosomal protein S21